MTDMSPVDMKWTQVRWVSPYIAKYYTNEGRSQDFFFYRGEGNFDREGPKSKAHRAESGGGVLASQSPPHQLGSLGAL